ncbi:endonuclease/exonuclease/phosphatase family protein [Desertivirga xinjiangensis]|uniref:endonuclease/exonuclease/phosphatase family protein n=1 Tax=Desertivirga xinjiangensis TaxID=539206 RepID=UPI00210A4140|nr:endonuclease/exonuclease/phosphatase family protein [Pedobacter xinjiangensis]
MENNKTSLLNFRAHIRSFALLALVAFLLTGITGITGCKKTDETVAAPETGELNDDTLRVISYNILEGMKNDRAKNYDNFVAWVKSYDPDILLLQEANGFTQESLQGLAARFDHPYVLTNLKATDNYPVAITSRFPLESRRRVTLNVSHGAIFAKLSNRNLNLVVTHLWPQNYWHQQGDGLGNDYRLQEINTVLDSTIRKFPQESNWILAGDFNAVAAKDYEAGNTANSYVVTDAIESAGFTDAIHFLHGYKQKGTSPNSVNNSFTYPFTYPGRRIDFVYATPAVLQGTFAAQPIYDDFTRQYSDHPPMIMDIDTRNIAKFKY